MGLSRSGWAWDVKLADFDNDGFLEVVQAAGFTKGEVNRWPEMQELALGNDELMSDPRFYHPIQPGDDVAGQDHDAFFVRAKDGRYSRPRHAHRAGGPDAQSGDRPGRCGRRRPAGLRRGEQLGAVLPVPQRRPGPRFVPGPAPAPAGGAGGRAPGPPCGPATRIAGSKGRRDRRSVPP